jgi:hypothetical protein
MSKRGVCPISGTQRQRGAKCPFAAASPDGLTADSDIILRQLPPAPVDERAFATAYDESRAEFARKARTAGFRVVSRRIPPLFAEPGDELSVDVAVLAVRCGRSLFFACF